MLESGFEANTAYVALVGNAILVDDSKAKSTYWKEAWTEFYPDKADSYLLIKVVLERLEMASYKHGILGDPKTWKAPAVDFGPGKSN